MFKINQSRSIMMELNRKNGNEDSYTFSNRRLEIRHIFSAIDMVWIIESIRNVPIQFLHFNWILFLSRIGYFYQSCCTLLLMWTRFHKSWKYRSLYNLYNLWIGRYSIFPSCSIQACDTDWYSTRWRNLNIVVHFW